MILQNNKRAMDLLQDSSLDQALKLLLHSSALLQDSSVPRTSGLWGLTFNNLGCVYKKAENKKSALYYFSKALDMEIQSTYDATNVASTHLNISAILSSMGDHETSLAHSLASLKTMQACASRSPNCAVPIVLAYHSIGIENEFLKRGREAAVAFHKGWEVAEKELGAAHRLTETLRKSYARACNLPTMPVLGSKKKKKIKMRSSMKLTSAGTNSALPVISTKASRLSSLTKDNSSRISKNTSFNRSADQPNMRYTLRVRNSLSPMATKYNYMPEIESIQKLIAELDGKPKAEKIKGVRNNYKNYARHVILIQKVWRGYLARKAVKLMRRKQKIKAIASIHRRFSDPVQAKLMKKGRILRPIPEIKVENKLDAIICIQSYFRMHLQRRKYRILQQSAIIIQKNFKRCHTRKLFLLIRAAVIFIQSVFRGSHIRKHISSSAKVNNII